MKESQRFSAFAEFQHVATGPVDAVVATAKQMLDDGQVKFVLFFDNQTGRQLDFDLRGSVEDVVDRVRNAGEKRGRGRPKLGVECNELRLLPRHWEWLAAQPRSASATMLRLIDTARKQESPEDKLRERTDAIGTFMWVLTGALPGGLAGRTDPHGGLAG